MCWHVWMWQSDSSVLYRKLCAASDVLAGDDILRWNLANTSIPSQLKVRRTGPPLTTIAQTRHDGTRVKRHAVVEAIKPRAII